MVLKHEDLLEVMREDDRQRWRMSLEYWKIQREKARAISDDTNNYVKYCDSRIAEAITEIMKL